MCNFANVILNSHKGKTSIYSLGQAGFVLKSSGGQLLGIDMYLTDCVERVEGHVGYHRLLPKILSPDSLCFDVIIATHPHRDHFDEDAMPKLMKNEETKLYASMNCRNDVEGLGISLDRTTFVKPGMRFENGDFEIDFINCDHGEGAPDAVGAIITVDGKRILAVGDTCLRLDRVDEYIKRGRPDVMLAAINGAYGNLNERECVLLAKSVKPKITVPCHYGMFASHGGNPGLFYEEMRNNAPELGFRLLCQGEALVL